LYAASSAIPITVVQGIVSALIRMQRPIGSAPGQSARAMDSLTTVTLGARSPSAPVKGRPRTTRVLITPKYSGVANWMTKRPSF
jgi:hypothetical protein